MLLSSVSTCRLAVLLGTLPPRAPPAQHAAGGRDSEQRGGAAHGG